MYKGRASNPNTCQNEILKWKYNNGKNQNWDDMSLKRCLILSVYFTFTKRIPEEVYRCYMYGGNTGRQTWSRNITTWIVLIYRYKPFLISENVRLSSSGQLHFLVNWVLSRNTFPVVIIQKDIRTLMFIVAFFAEKSIYNAKSIYMHNRMPFCHKKRVKSCNCDNKDGP